MAEEQNGQFENIETCAFVGAAGTGKSQRAQYVASLLNADYIIDDGLIIHKGSVLCGKSAKSELNRVSAIRRAIFDFEDHRQEVRKLLSGLESAKIMIIATSDSMVKKIAQKLGLTPPTRTVRIEEVATAKEMKKAHHARYGKGQHVIPVSRAIVRKNFAGKLVGQLRVFWNSSENSGAEKTVVRPPYSFYGEVHIEPKAIKQIACFVAQRTSQVADIDDISLNQGSNGLIIGLNAVAIFGDKNLFETAKSIKSRVSASVKYFTGVDISKINVTVSEVIS